MSVTSTNRADGFAPSPDGNYVALDLHGDIRVVPAEQGIGENISGGAHPVERVVAGVLTRRARRSPTSPTSGDQEVWVFDIALR